ncbi:MAG: hypothetical protein ACPGUD_05265 [Parashewanella sp.]
MKTTLVLVMVLLLSHCSSIPQPPHCQDNGKGLQPVNTHPIELKPVEAAHD